MGSRPSSPQPRGGGDGGGGAAGGRVGGKGGVGPAPLQTLSGHSGNIRRLVLSQDGSLMVSASDDATAWIWTTDTGETAGLLRGHTNGVSCVAIQDTWVVTGSLDNTLRKWDTVTGECTHTYKGHTMAVTNVMIVGSVVVSSSRDSTVRVWALDPKTPEEDVLRTFQGHNGPVEAIMAVLPSEDDSSSIIVLSGSSDKTARAWDMQTKKAVVKFKGHRGSVIHLATDGEGSVLFTGSTDGEVRSWVLSDGDPLMVMQTGVKGGVSCMMVVGPLLYAGYDDGTVRSWLHGAGEQLGSFSTGASRVNAVKYRSGVLFAACGDSAFRSYSAKSGDLLAEYGGHDGPVNSLVVVGKKGGRVFSGSADGSVKVWDASAAFKTVRREDLAERREAGEFLPVDKWGRRYSTVPAF